MLNDLTAGRVTQFRCGLYDTELLEGSAYIMLELE